MKRLPSCLAAALLSLALASAAVAQTETSPQPRVIGGPLARADVLQMSLAPLSEQARACGLEPNLIPDSFKPPLTEKNIVIQEAAHVWHPLPAPTPPYTGHPSITPTDPLPPQNPPYSTPHTQPHPPGP